MTLIEVIVAVAITGLIISVVGSFARNIFYYNRVTSGGLTAVQDARSIIRTMVAELRSASPSSNGAYPIVTAGTSSIGFFSDIDGNGTKEQVRYYLNGTKLYRGVIVPTGSPLVYASSSETTSLLASNIRNTASSSVFEYYAGTYNGTTATTSLSQPVTVTAVRLVRINLTIDVDINSAPISRSYTTQVTLRNLKDNL